MFFTAIVIHRVSEGEIVEEWSESGGLQEITQLRLKRFAEGLRSLCKPGYRQQASGFRDSPHKPGATRDDTPASSGSLDIKTAVEQEIRERARVEQELQVARRIQHALLPKTLPTLRGWDIADHYRPAREVGGDFYDLDLF